jgi:hypothetical protein
MTQTNVCAWVCVLHPTGVYHPPPPSFPKPQFNTGSSITTNPL